MFRHFFTYPFVILLSHYKEISNELQFIAYSGSSIYFE